MQSYQPYPIAIAPPYSRHGTAPEPSTSSDAATLPSTSRPPSLYPDLPGPPAHDLVPANATFATNSSLDPNDPWAMAPPLAAGNSLDAQTRLSALLSGSGRFMSTGVGDGGDGGDAPLSPSMPLRVTVSNPQLFDERRAVPGLRKKFVSYLLTTTTSLPWSAPTVTVRRRFSEFVLLEQQLQMTYRGCFVPTRPAKHNTASGKLQPRFIERRRQSMALFLRRLASHPVLAHSPALRVFLESPEELRTSAAWRQQAAATPTWAAGVRLLFAQVLGRQRMTPAPAAAAQPTSASHDVVRHVREALYQYRHRHSDGQGVPDQEATLRQRSDLVRALATALATLAHTATGLHQAEASAVVAADELGGAMAAMGAFEDAAAHVLAAHAQRRLGVGCRAVSAASGRALAHLGSQVRALEEQARNMRGVLAALATREEALLTVQTLDVDIARKRARAQDLQAHHSPNAGKLLQEVAVAEAAKEAALGEYLEVARRNGDEMAGFGAAQMRDALRTLYTWVRTVEARAAAEADAWAALAGDLGGDPAFLAALAE